MAKGGFEGEACQFLVVEIPHIRLILQCFSSLFATKSSLQHTTIDTTHGIFTIGLFPYR